MYGGIHETITYNSSNPNVCSVTNDGMVSALNEGQSDITIVYGNNLVAKTVKVYVSSAGRSTTSQYKSVVNAINKVYKKYGKQDSITSKNFKTAWKEILEADKQLKEYSQYVETFYGLDADTQNLYYSDYPEFYYVNALGSTLDDIVHGSLHGVYRYLRGWGNEFCGNHLLCVDVWKLEVVVNNLTSYIEKINPYNEKNSNAFAIKSIKRNTKTGELRIKLKQKVTEKQMYGSFVTPEYFTGEPLVWTSLLQANTELKSMPCEIRLTGESGTYRFVGEYEIAKDNFKVKPEWDDQNKLPVGKYEVVFKPISSGKIFYELFDEALEYPVAITQSITIK